MNKFEKLLSHDFCANSIEVVEDENVLILNARVLDFKKSPNGWGITEEVCEKYMHTIIGKHIVTKYFVDTDTLGGHEDNKQKFRLGDFDIPHKDTNSIGTVLDVWIDWIDENDESKGKAMYVKCTLMVLEHINEVTLIQEWLEKGIKVNLSVEWFYSESVVIDGVEWIANPTFSNICVLNSESKNGKQVIKGNYDVAELGINLLDEMNNAILKDFKMNNEEGDRMKNRLLEALNGLSVDEITSGIYSALEKIMTAEEYYDVYVWDIYPDDKYFLTRNWNDEWGIYKKYDYTVAEDGAITVKEGVLVKKEEVFVPVSVMNEKINEVQAELEKANEERAAMESSANEIKVELETKIATLEVDNSLLSTEKQSLSDMVNELSVYKEKQEKQEYEEKLNAKITYYEAKFNEVGEVEKFNSEEIQLKIKEMVNSDELVALKAENEVNKFLLDKKVNSTEKSLIHQGLNSNMDGLIPKDAKTLRKEQFGF